MVLAQAVLVHRGPCGAECSNWDMQDQGQWIIAHGVIWVDNCLHVLCVCFFVMLLQAALVCPVPMLGSAANGGGMRSLFWVARRAGSSAKGEQ